MAASGKNPKKRNSLAGTSKGKSKSAKYFRDNPKAKAKKDAYNTEYHKTKERKDYRAGLNKANKDSPNGKGVDKSHTKKGKIVNEKQSSNRKRNGRGGTAKKK